MSVPIYQYIQENRSQVVLEMAFQKSTGSFICVSRMLQAPRARGWGGGGTPLYRLYGDVPLDRVWFLAPLHWTGYIISSDSALIWFWSRPRQGTFARLSSSIWQSEIGDVHLYLFSRSSVNIRSFSGLDITAIFSVSLIPAPIPLN